MLSFIQITVLALLANAAPLPTLENTDFLIPGTMITTTKEAANDPAVIKFWQDRVAAQDAQKHAENAARAQSDADAASVERWLLKDANKQSLPSTDHLIPGTSITGTAEQAANPEFLKRIRSPNRAWALERTDRLIPGTTLTGTAEQAKTPEFWQQLERSGDGIESAVTKAAPGFLEKTKSVLSKLRFW